MDIRGAVNTVLYGPADELDAALAAIRAAGIVAHPDAYEAGAICATHHDGTHQPTPEYVEECEERVRTAAVGTDFTVDRTSVWDGSSITSRKLPYDRHTGEWLEELFDTDAPVWLREEQLARLAARKGITVADIELRDSGNPTTRTRRNRAARPVPR
ncbi:hypothetical protein G4Z16_01390 [Streptomyces bathyalis]|uniref:Uncharacterized protein n=1 Tax=Streptomyces bathyalis TaxID=2710756 RepID=A0A7T1WQG0_9ACTN|nr:hypothetical protein [Streptomyces bathyalis]QPP05259.1 hypothetical protein G4Z16_01390 [Streptomyces bathyalis]